MDAELIPAVRQTLWGRLAVANFFLGGAGAGAYVVGAILAGLERSPILVVGSVLGPALVAAGFLCVAVEAGRPLRAPLVLTRIRRSWMSRELWVGGAFVLFAVADLLRPLLAWRIGAVASALLLTLAQGAILSRAKAVSAWSVPLMPVLFLVSALVSGAGVLGLGGLWWVPGHAEALASWMAQLTILSALVWGGYLTWPGDLAFRRATAAFRADAKVAVVFVAGHLLPLLFLTVGYKSPGLIWGALAGVAILLGQLQAKAWLVLRAGELRPITIPQLRFRGEPRSQSGG